jgi:hypothetical protein
MYWSNPSLDFKVAKVISWLWNHDDGPWPCVPLVLDELCHSRRFILYVLEHYQVCFLCDLQDIKKDYALMSFVQFSFFKFIMSQNAEGVIVEHSNLNPMSTLWKRIQSFVILSHKLNKWNWQRLQWFRCYWDWNLKYLSLPMSNLAACCKPSSHHKLWQTVGSFAVNFCFRVWTFSRWFLGMALIKWLICISQLHRTGRTLSMAGIWYVYFDSILVWEPFLLQEMRLNLEHYV